MQGTFKSKEVTEQMKCEHCHIELCFEPLKQLYHISNLTACYLTDIGYHKKIHLASDLCLNIAELKLIKKLQKECKLFTGSGTSTLQNTIGKK